MSDRLPNPPPFVDLRQLTEYIPFSERTIENFVKQGMFPAPRRLGTKRFWRWKDVERYLADIGASAPTAPSDQAERITNETRKALAGS